MQRSPYPGSATSPQETLAFCHWLLSDVEESGFGAEPSAAVALAGMGGGARENLARWHRLLRDATEDGFSQLLRAVRREAALLAERAAPQSDEVGRADPLAKAVGRAASRLTALAASAPTGSQTARALQELPEPLLRELVAGYVDATRPGGETERRLTTRVAELAALQKINSVVNSSLDLSQVLAQTVDVLAEVMHADVTAIYLFEETGRLVLRATRGLNPAAVGKTSLSLGEGITGWTAQYGRPVALADARRDPRFAHLPALMEEPYHGWLSVPIILFRQSGANNKLVGVLNIQTRAVKAFTPEE